MIEITNFKFRKKFLIRLEHIIQHTTKQFLCIIFTESQYRVCSLWCSMTLEQILMALACYMLLFMFLPPSFFGLHSKIIIVLGKLYIYYVSVLLMIVFYDCFPFFYSYILFSLTRYTTEIFSDEYPISGTKALA